MSVFHSSAFPSSCYLALVFLAMRLQGLLTWIDGTDLHLQILVAAFCPVWAAFIELLSWFLEAVPFYCSTVGLQKVSSCKHRFPWQHNRKVLEQVFLLSRPAVWPTAAPEHVCSCCAEGCAYRFPRFPQSLLLVGLATVLVTWRKLYVCPAAGLSPKCVVVVSPSLQSAYSTLIPITAAAARLLSFTC